jgi:hypothetical protein
MITLPVNEGHFQEFGDGDFVFVGSEVSVGARGREFAFEADIDRQVAGDGIVTAGLYQSGIFFVKLRRATEPVSGDVSGAWADSLAGDEGGDFKAAGVRAFKFASRRARGGGEGLAGDGGEEEWEKNKINGAFHKLIILTQKRKAAKILLKTFAP